MSKRLPTSLPGGFATLGLASALAACPQGSYLPVTDTLTDTTGSGPSTSSEPTATSDPTTGSEPPPCNMNGACDQGESVMLCPDECKACGNGEIDGGEACDDGVANSKDNAYHEGTPDTAPCNSSCTKRVDFCGDGICQMYDEDSISCAQDGCTPVCGNGVMEVGEDCDDGNLENSDACLNSCKNAKCGDGVVQQGAEQCDDGNQNNADGCTNQCVVGEIIPLDPKVMQCGDWQRPIADFIPEGLEFQIVDSCTPDADTQAMFVSRNGQVNAAQVKAYVEAGGRVITEVFISDDVYNAVFQTNVGEVGFTGGINICDDYVPHEGLGWRDTHLRLSGPVVAQLQLVFVEDWHWATDEELALNWSPERAAEDRDALIVATGPADEIESGSLYFCNAINAAQRRLWIASPYFVPDIDILRALQLAGRSMK